MGIFDVYCPICGVSNNNNHDNARNRKWLQVLTCVTFNEKVYSPVSVDDSLNIYVLPKNKETICVYPPYWHEPKLNYDADGYGIAFHRDCYAFINKTFGHKIQFANMAKMVHNKKDMWSDPMKHLIVNKSAVIQN